VLLIALTSDVVAAMLPETVRQLVRVARARRHVLEHLEQALKVVSFHYIEDFLREASITEIQRKSLLSM
jgi:hypothetical protein